MNDLISRSQAKQEILAWAVRIGAPQNLSTEDTMFVIDNLPAVDAVEVVRCKNCKYWGRSPFSNSTAIGWCKLAGGHLRPDFYCASGVKKA